MNRIFLQRGGWRTRNYFAAQIVLAIVTGAPDQLSRRIVLHDAAQMRATRREGAPFGLREPDEQHGLGAEFDDLASVGGQILPLAADHLVHRGLDRKSTRLNSSHLGISY